MTYSDLLNTWHDKLALPEGEKATGSAQFPALTSAGPSWTDPRPSHAQCRSFKSPMGAT